ncbi:MAG: glutamate ligase domain-containing protein [Acutalibacteraceae bacterium]
MLAVTRTIETKRILNRNQSYQGRFREGTVSGQMGDCTENPLIIIDGAHNQDGIDMLKASVKQYLPNRTIVAVIGALRDKDTDYMIHALSDVFHHVITITPNNPRAMDAKTFALRWIACGQQATAAESVEDALYRAEQLIGENGVILVCGSLFVAAEVREKIKYHFMEK